MHVLIIEDEAMLAADLQCFLEELGADSSDVADSEQDAIEAALARPPDLITADVTLRQGTGTAAVQAIRNEIGHVPVVFVTAGDMTGAAFDANTHKVKKPILWLELVEALAEHDLPPAYPVPRGAAAAPTAL
jgi:CheY-like chemotaxis protein